MEFTLQEAKELVDIKEDLILIYKKNNNLGIWGGDRSNSYDYYLEYAPDAIFIQDYEYDVIIFKNNKLNQKLYPNNIQYKNYLIVDKSKETL